MNILYQLDITIFRWLNAWIGWSNFIAFTIYARSEILPYVLMFGLILFWFFYKSEIQKIQNRFMVLEALAAGLVSRFVITEIIKLAYNRPRPFEVLDGVRLLIQHDAGKSFPSGHATFFFAIAAIVFLHYRKTGILFFIATLSMTLGRVSAGLHWPSDILAGAVIGIIIAALIHRCENRLPLNLKYKVVNFCKKY